MLISGKVTPHYSDAKNNKNFELKSLLNMYISKNPLKESVRFHCGNYTVDEINLAWKKPSVFSLYQLYYQPTLTTRSEWSIFPIIEKSD